MNGKNVADFIDPEIEAKLNALELEEERLIAEGFYESDDAMVIFLIYLILSLTMKMKPLQKLQMRLKLKRTLLLPHIACQKAKTDLRSPRRLLLE